LPSACDFEDRLVIYASLPTLLLIDIQKGFDDPVWGARNNPQAEDCIQLLLTAWRNARAPIIHIRHDSTEAWSPLRPGQSGNGFKLEATPMDGERILSKTVNSAFIGTSLADILKGSGIETLVIAGLTTNHCVSTTARMAGNLGFKTFVVEDATAAFDRRALDGSVRPASDVHLAALSDLQGEFATIVSTANAIQRLG
jgi:nicotinamidase-related amidase